MAPRVYYASREDIYHVDRLKADLAGMKGGAYIGVIGGLGTLNFIATLAPRKILLVDVNPEQVEYARCVLDLIRLSPTREEFAEGFFSRKYTDKESVFLGQKGDAGLFERTLGRVGNPGAFRRFFSVIRDAPFEAGGLRLRGNDLCRILKLRGPERGTPVGENFLYFGRGWLKDGASYTRLRKILNGADLELACRSIDRVEAGPEDGLLVFHASNVPESAAGPYRRFLAKAHERLSRLSADLTFVSFSTYHDLNRTRFKAPRAGSGDVHADCAAKVSAYARGRDVLELVPGEHRFGSELRAKSVEVRRFDGRGPGRLFDVVVFHILYGSRLLGLSREGFSATLRRWLPMAKQLVILEHNGESRDFRGRRMLRLGDIVRALSSFSGLEVGIEFSCGFRDGRRNMIVGVRLPSSESKEDRRRPTPSVGRTGRRRA